MRVCCVGIVYAARSNTGCVSLREQDSERVHVSPWRPESVQVLGLSASSWPSAFCCVCCRLSLWHTSKAWPTVRTIRMAWLCKQRQHTHTHTGKLGKSGKAQRMSGEREWGKMLMPVLSNWEISFRCNVGWGNKFSYLSLLPKMKPRSMCRCRVRASGTRYLLLSKLFPHFPQTSSGHQTVKQFLSFSFYELCINSKSWLLFE